jgi:hypothetical protein
MPGTADVKMRALRLPCSEWIIYNPQAKSTQFEVGTAAQFLPWCSVAVRTIPNVRVFLELMRRAYFAFRQQLDFG